MGAAALRFTTKSSDGSEVLLCRKTSRTHRFMRLRTFAFPTFFVAVTPILLPEVFSTTNRTQYRPNSFSPRSYASRNSRRLAIRAAFGNCFSDREELAEVALTTRPSPHAPEGKSLDSESLTPLTAATRKDGHAVFGPHTDSESVRALATAVVGLICTFHRKFLK